MAAHKSAWEKLRILHRDVSIGNIMINVSKRTKRRLLEGVLGDWDMAKEHFDDETPSPRREGRVVRPC